jgi:hypothetical protein
MSRSKKPAEPEPWADPWTGYWWHSKPVAKSLYILDQLGVLVGETGRTDKNARAAFYPFSVSIKVTPLTPAPHPKTDQHGQPCGVYLPGDTFIICSRRELHEIAAEAQRRAEQAKNEEEP